jgi:hypothetical protein
MLPFPTGDAPPLLGRIKAVAAAMLCVPVVYVLLWLVNTTVVGRLAVGRMPVTPPFPVAARLMAGMSAPTSALKVGAPVVPFGEASTSLDVSLAKAILMFPDVVIGVLVMVNTEPVWVSPTLLTDAAETLQVGQAMFPVALMVIGPVAPTAMIPPAAGMLIVKLLAVETGEKVVDPPPTLLTMNPAVGSVNAVAPEKFQVLPVAVNVPVLEFVPLVIPLHAVDDVALAVRVQSFRLAPMLFTQLMVMLEPGIQLTPAYWVWTVPFTYRS